MIEEVDPVTGRPLAQTAWEKALDFTLSYEGGYAFDPNDRGGETFRGISRKAWPTWVGWPKVDAVKAAFENNRYLYQALLHDRGLLADAVLFYKTYFWDQIRGEELPPKVAVATFDMAVHSGAKQAVKLLQVVLGVTVDGIVGPATVKAANDRGEGGLEDYLAARCKFLFEIMDTAPDQKVWAMNWFRRLMRLANLVLEGPGLDFPNERRSA